MLKRKYYYIIFIFSLQGCAWFSSSNQAATRSNVKVPKVASIITPGGVSNQWRYLGTTDNGQIAEEINDKSIKSTALQVYSFQDRKTIVDTTQYFQNNKNIPPYKYIISSWQMDCANKQYLLTAAILYSESGLMIESNNYQNDQNIRWLKFGSGSIGELQFNYICLNQNRMLGY